MKKLVKRLSLINENAAGIDIDTEMIFISVGGLQVKSFPTYTANLLEACNYLKTNNVTNVAMQATRVYWIVLYDLLQSNNIEVFVFNGAHIKNVPGRKSDTQDCQWIRQLHSYGLLRSSFCAGEQYKKAAYLHPV